MDSQLTLTYVDIRGLAEPINLILIDANIDYRDERMSLSQWNSRKLEGIYGPVYGQVSQPQQWLLTHNKP